MAKYSSNKVRECEEWIAQHGLMDYGGAQLQQYCAAMGIHDTTHRAWMAQKEYSEAVERGKNTFKISHTQKLFGTLMEAAIGGDHETVEENTEYRANPENPNKPRIHKMFKHKRKTYIKPDTTAAIFLLCNLDPEHWRQRQDNNIAFKKPAEEEMTLDEVKEELKRLEQGR